MSWSSETLCSSGKPERKRERRGPGGGGPEDERIEGVPGGWGGALWYNLLLRGAVKRFGRLVNQ